jgi:RNA polymerase sigma-70 factor (ECF subfamily)
MSILLLENLLLESGIRNINELAKRYKKAKIYFHQDLDGVTTAIGMKNYLERNGIKVVDAEIIQYGDKEFSIKKPDASGEVMPVLVDFAHGKPMFTIHTDHHDTQVGVEKGASTSFRHSRSNVETISNVVSTSDIFPSQDIMMISTIDSADYARLDITPDDVMNFVFNLDKGKNLQRNKISMALVTNKLLLAYKNKPKFLETLVMRCTPSLLNIFQNITKLAKEFGYATAQEMKANLEDYIKKQSTSKDVQYDSEYGIIKQYGGGSMFKAGSYDRYVPFKLYPEANFLVITWPLGLLQASCNPFKKSRELKGVNLGEIAQEVLETYKSELKNKIITIDSVKYFAEKNKEFSEDSVGFSYEDMIAILGDTENGIMGLNQIPKGASPDYTLERWQNAIKKIMSKSYNELTERESKALKMLSVNGWDMIQANSGGHKCITNISGLSYFGKDGVPFLKKFSDEFVFKLKQKIDGENVSENIFTKKKLLKEIEESDKTKKFDQIYSKMWHKMLNQVCMKYTKNKDEAEDFCQNGFIKVYRNLDKYDEKGSLEGWVKRVVNNSILDELRKKKLSFVNGGEDGFDFSRYNVGDEEYEEEFSIEDIEKVLPQLSPGFRKAFELHYIDGLKYDEVGKKLGISTSTAKTNAMRAKNKIKEFLGY